MLIHSTAPLGLHSESLRDALTQVAEYARQHLVAAEHSEVSISVHEKGTRIRQVLAPLLPGPAPEGTHSPITLKASALGDPLALYDELARAVPASGRGVMLLLVLKGWRFRGDPLPADVDLTLSRLRHGARALSAGLNIRFHALSLKDPVVKTTIAAAGERAGLRFGKPMAAFAAAANMPFGAPASPVADTRLEPPNASSQLIVLQTFDEALAQAADRIAAKPEDLASAPMLFSRSGGFEKRMTDVMAGKKESIDLPAHLKRFVRERFPAYSFDAADGERLWFRRAIAPTLDLLLMFDRIHQWGLGKTFTVEFGVDFPNTQFGGMHTGLGGTRRNIFWLFHEAWQTRVWAYTTATELQAALESCGSILTRVLPAVEQECHGLLLPIPVELPEGIEQRGPLSARQAYEIVLPRARAWGADVELESVASVNLMNAGYPLGAVESSVGEDGRLRNPGSWGFKFLSRRLDRNAYYTVPHTGRIWWAFYPVLEGATPKYPTVVPPDEIWIDSTEIAPRAFSALRERLDGLRLQQVWIALHDVRRSGDVVWEARGLAYEGPAPRHDVTVRFDRRTGALLKTA